MKKHDFSIASLVLVAAWAGACGSSQTNSTSQSAPPEAELAAPPADIGEGIAWAEKSKEQKIAVMKTKVMPAVQDIWKQSPNPDEEVTCSTCHGSGAMQGNFEMPTTAIVALDPREQFAAHADEADWLAFMGTTLVPTMAEVLELAPFDPATRQGFGCFACHTMVKPN